MTLDGDTPAAIIYTSGTTGASKGAVLTHNNFRGERGESRSRAGRSRSATASSSRCRSSTSTRSATACTAGSLSGCRMRLLERFDHRSRGRGVSRFPADALLRRADDLRPPARNAARRRAARSAARMRLFVSGSAPLPAHVLERFRALFGHTILERYGMTETFMNISNPYAGERRAGTVGFPLPVCHVRIEDGELLVRGPNVFAGYWRRPMRRRRVHGRRLVPHRRSRRRLRRRLLHAPRPQERSDHLRRLQHLSARDRGAAARAAGRRRSGRGRG